MFPRAVFLLLFILTPFLQSSAQEEMSDMKGFRAEFLGMFNEESNKVLQLLDAMPADKFSWRPQEGVRSVGEVYAHIAGTNLMFPSLIAGDKVDFQALMGKEKELTDKAAVREYLAKSIDDVKIRVKSMSDADLEKPVTIEFIPLTTTARGVLMMMYGHLGEHLGQSIAYARMNAITPPWTAAQQAQENTGY